MEPIIIPYAVFKTSLDSQTISTQASPLEKAILELKQAFQGCFNTGSSGREGRDGRESRDGGRESYHGRPHSSQHNHWGAHREHPRQGSHGYSSHSLHGSHSHHANSQRRGHSGHPRRQERPRIGLRELSREDISRKDFMANMNKMSRQNYESILRHIRTTYNSNFLTHYMDIVWMMMIRQIDYQDIYILVIQHLMDITPADKKRAVVDYWNERCRDYFDSRAWMPTNDLLDSMNEEYDEFCDYIKWKKQTAACLTGWLRLMRDGIIDQTFENSFDKIMAELENAMNASSHRLLDCFLEWLLRMVELKLKMDYPYTYISQLNHWMEVIKERQLSSALRFKIIDILNLMESS